MGIQGLLPLLKPIQRQRHLSDFAGQTLAVDAYVWLHRGAYACAAELVQKRPTRRYVDFCMARVRLLRHHGIEPYLVFDGGPLPAKLGTEKDRERKREENIRRANELKAQGKDIQAAEYYVKCVDVTPQMAYQVIKALKVEKVQYVVAPYEADAQLAYLERAGIVDGIITEDSDLLVFGCRNVLVKLDTVAATVVSISRSDFGSPTLAASSFSLIGWTDAQFRWMAMLSGCDYLPSISGVGLKTAYQLLKKYKVVDRAIKMIRLEGKKTVPKGYLDSFYLAEKVFLHQRVYDPGSRQLVYLTNTPEHLCLDEAAEVYIGRDLEPCLATRVATGDVCPISLSAMEDINPSFNPRPIKSTMRRPLQTRDTNSSEPPKSKTPNKKGSILSFLTPVPRAPSGRAKSPVKSRGDQPRIVSGNASGKRTLFDLMEEDAAAKRKKLCAENDHQRESQTELLSTSRFFGNLTPCIATSGSVATDKENFDPEEVVEPIEVPDDPVAQEDGYLSPSPSLSRAVTPELSSPVVPYKENLQTTAKEDDVEFSQDIAEPVPEDVERIFVRGSSEPVPEADVENVIPGPDLARNLAGVDDDDDRAADRASSEIYCWEDDDADPIENSPRNDNFVEPTPPMSATPSQKGTSAGSTRTNSFDSETAELELLDIDEEEILVRQRNAVHERLAEKWRRTYSLGSHLAAGTEGSATSTKLTLQCKATDCDTNRVASRPPGTPSTNGIGRRATSRTTSDPSIPYSRHHQARPNEPVAKMGCLARVDSTIYAQNSHADVGSAKNAMRATPITIHVDEPSDVASNSSRAKLQTFRFIG